MPSRHCPNCDADISDSYQDDDPSVGIYGGWYCDACDLPVALDDYEPLDDDVQIFGVDVGTCDQTALALLGGPGGRPLAIAMLPAGATITDETMSALYKMASHALEAVTDEFLRNAYARSVGVLSVREDGSVEDVSERFLSGGGGDDL